MINEVLKTHVFASQSSARGRHAQCTCGYLLEWDSRHDQHKMHLLEVVAAQAWDEGHDAGYEDARDYHAFGFGCGPDPSDCNCPNPYRSAP